MKTRLNVCAAVAIAVGLAGTSASAQWAPAAPPPQQQADAGSEQQVRAATEQFVQASRSGDRQALGRLLARDVAWVDGWGAVHGRDEMVTGRTNPPVEVIVDRVKMFGDTAAVTGSARFESGEKVRFLEEWMNRNGAWTLYAHQSTALSPAPAAPPAPTGTSGRLTGSRAAPALRSPEERDLWRVAGDLQRACDTGDVATCSHYTADEFFRVEPTGEERTKPDLLREAQANEGSSRSQLEVGDVQVAVFGDAARVMLTKWGTGSNGRAVAPTRVTQIFVNRDGRWQQAAEVLTPIAER